MDLAGSNSRKLSRQQQQITPGWEQTRAAGAGSSAHPHWINGNMDGLSPVCKRVPRR